MPRTTHAIPTHIQNGEPVMKLPVSVPYPWNVQTAPTTSKATPAKTRPHLISPLSHGTGDRLGGIVIAAIDNGMGLLGFQAAASTWSPRSSSSWP